MARKPKGMKALQRWVGSWDSRYTVTFADGNVRAGTMSVIAEPIAKGQGVWMRAKGSVVGIGPWEADALWGYDTEPGRVHWFAVSSMGEVHDHSGAWRDANTLDLAWHGMEEGKKALERTSFVWRSSAEVVMKTVFTVGGALGHTIEGTWKKIRKRARSRRK